MINFETHPERYNHWKLSYDGPVATLALDVAEDKGLAPGYKLKLNSYDLGVDIELHDALNRIRFEHPEVKSAVITSGKSRMFCSGANIYMLGTSSHASKVNFCKFTNETRNGIEDSSKQGGLKFIAAINGPCAGGGYELALACDEIMMVDDRSSTVSLPEVPLLGVLPGTGGLTRLVDKRKVRRDLADMFCTTAEGVRADRAQEWRLVDHVAKPQAFADEVKKRAEKLALLSDRPGGQGVALTPLGENRLVKVDVDDEKRVATITISGPRDLKMEKSADWYPLRLARELDRAILDLRHNHHDVGLVTATPDDFDWEDEIRLAIEERASLSPDALTAMEASLRFAGAETMHTRVFGRLTAWQNWVFNRPNAVGEQGALKVYGSGAKPKFNWERV